jgi:tetratricopeptide (TPR) repeat protein|eukprot:COSAG03_NODE_1404_length_4153_cov_2.675629_3_plen_594_part_00
MRLLALLLAAPLALLAASADLWRGSTPPSAERCAIARRHAKELGPHSFASEFQGKLPVLLDGHKGVRRARKFFGPSALLAAAGNASVQVGNAAEIVRAHGQGPHTATLSAFVQQMREPVPGGSPVPYLFDRGAFFAQPGAVELLSRLPFPAGLIHQRTRDEEPPSLMGFILDGNDERGEPVPSWDHYLLLGGNGSSVGFHAHADSVVALLFGAKRWFLFPPDATPRPRWRDPRGMETWAWQHSRGEGEPAAAGTESGSEMLECIQRPGEILYVPEGWYHATLNYGETLAVAQQARVGRSEWYRLRLLGTQLANAKAFADASEVMEATLRRYPEQAEAYAALATLLLDMLEPGPGSGVPPFAGDPATTESLWQRVEQLLVAAVHLDRTDDGSHVNLCKILTRRALAVDGYSPEQQAYRTQVLEAAAMHCKQAVTLAPESFQARFYAGGERSASGDLDGALAHYAAAVVLDMDSAEAHFQLSRVLLRKAFEVSPPPPASSTASMARGAAQELSQAAELLCGRCVASAGGVAAAATHCECLGSTPRGRALSLLVAGDAGDGLLERDEVLAAIERELQLADHTAEDADTPTTARGEL